MLKNPTTNVMTLLESRRSEFTRQLQNTLDEYKTMNPRSGKIPSLIGIIEKVKNANDLTTLNQLQQKFTRKAQQSGLFGNSKSVNTALWETYTKACSEDSTLKQGVNLGGASSSVQHTPIQEVACNRASSSGQHTPIQTSEYFSKKDLFYTRISNLLSMRTRRLKDCRAFSDALSNTKNQAMLTLKDELDTQPDPLLIRQHLAQEIATINTEYQAKKIEQNQKVMTTKEVMTTKLEQLKTLATQLANDITSLKTLTSLDDNTTVEVTSYDTRYEQLVNIRTLGLNLRTNDFNEALNDRLSENAPRGSTDSGATSRDSTSTNSCTAPEVTTTFLQGGENKQKALLEGIIKTEALNELYQWTLSDTPPEDSAQRLIDAYNAYVKKYVATTDLSHSPDNLKTIIQYHVNAVTLDNITKIHQEQSGEKNNSLINQFNAVSTAVGRRLEKWNLQLKNPNYLTQPMPNTVNKQPSLQDQLTARLTYQRDVMATVDEEFDQKIWLKQQAERLADTALQITGKKDDLGDKITAYDAFFNHVDALKHAYYLSSADPSEFKIDGENYSTITTECKDTISKQVTDLIEQATRPLNQFSSISDAKKTLQQPHQKTHCAAKNIPTCRWV